MIGKKRGVLMNRPGISKIGKFLTVVLVLCMVLVCLPIQVMARDYRPGPAPAVTNNDILNKVYGMAAGMEYGLDGQRYIAYVEPAFSAINFPATHIESTICCYKYNYRQ